MARSKKKSTAPANAEKVVVVEKVDKNYQLGQITVPALKNVSLTITKGSFTSIIGPSGSGKSTILNLMGGIDFPSTGRVLVNNTDINTLDDTALSRFRAREIGFIFQSFNLIPVLNVYENVEYPLLLTGDKKDKASQGERVLEMIEAVGLKDQVRQRPNELSGGQRQRVAIARALVTNPALVLADEPTANLDSRTGEAILELMHRLNAKYHTTFVFSTHDPVVMSHAKEKWHLKDGEVVKHDVH